MPSFDYMADETFEAGRNDWMEQAALARKHAYNSAILTDARSRFVQTHAIVDAHRGQGESQTLDVPMKVNNFSLNSSQSTKEDALKGYPQFSARLLLKFKVISPLLTRDDEPFYLFDNPARKDHIFKSPYLSAASIKGLSFDAYQRAFPHGRRQDPDTQQDCLRAYRNQDVYAVRLFGIADDGAPNPEMETQHQRGRLRFAPVWFRQLQFLVMNPQDPLTARGTAPIQFEAVAAGQTGCIEVVYFNPRGVADSDETTVRQDLARWLAAVASWWPVLGLGGKRLAGYGHIAIESVTLQAVDWLGIESDEPRSTSVKEAAPSKLDPPADYDRYLTVEGQLISEQDYQHRVEQQMLEWDAKIAALDQQRRYATGKAQSKAVKAWEKEKKKKESQLKQFAAGYRRACEYWQSSGHTESVKPDGEDEVPTLVFPDYRIDEKKLTGPESWLQMAYWMAGENHE